MSRPPAWHDEARRFLWSGVSAKDAAAAWGCSYFTAYYRLRTIEAVSGGRPWCGRGDSDAAKLPAEVPALASPKGVDADAAVAVLTEQVRTLADDVRYVSTAVAALSTQSTEQVAALAEDLRRAVAMVAALSAQPVRAVEPEPMKTITSVPPRELWAWLVVEAMGKIGEAATAKAIGVDVLVMRQIVTGTRTPSSAVRDRLRELTATLWARELFSGIDEVEDAREALGRSKR